MNPQKRIEELEAKNDGLIRQRDEMKRQLDIALEELTGDKGRLDWLSSIEQNIGNVQLPKKCVLDNMHSLRAAIDQAMALEDDDEMARNTSEDSDSIHRELHKEIMLKNAQLKNEIFIEERHRRESEEL